MAHLKARDHREIFGLPFGWPCAHSGAIVPLNLFSWCLCRVDARPWRVRLDVRPVVAALQVCGIDPNDRGNDAATALWESMANGQVVLVTTEPLGGGPPVRSVFFVAEGDPAKAAAIIAAMMAPNERSRGVRTASGSCCQSTWIETR